MNIPAVPGVSAEGALPGDWNPPENNAPVLVALSGGLDSSVLLHLLAASAVQRARGLRALHVHHGLHPDADGWAAHCVRQCEALGIDCTVRRVAVVPGGDGPEAGARRARRAAFAAELREGEALALAHHRDDQAETFLLRALRASGPDGLAAMRAWQRFARGWLWRPLLRVPRLALLRQAHAWRLSWLEDPSNADDAFDRNFLRHRVLPLLRERWPQAEAAFARAAALQADASQLLGEHDAAALDAATDGDARTLHVAPLQAMDPARRARLLRAWVASLGLPSLPARGIEAIERDLLHARRDGDAAFAWGGAQVRRWRDRLHAGAVHAPLPHGWTRDWDGAAPLALPDGASLQLLPANATAPPGTERFASEGERGPASPPWRVHARQGGERIMLAGRTHSHALKHVLQDLGVPPWERQRMPLLSARDGTLLAAGDAALSGAFADWLHARGARLHWQRADAPHDAAPGAPSAALQ